MSPFKLLGKGLIPHICHFLHRQDFRKPNLTPKKTTKITKNTKNVSEKVIYMHFFHSFWKNLHLTENFYTDMSVVSVTNKRYARHLFTLVSTPGKSKNVASENPSLCDPLQRLYGIE